MAAAAASPRPLASSRSRPSADGRRRTGIPGRALPAARLRCDDDRGRSDGGSRGAVIDITISQLRVIEAVARTGGISRAAREIGVSQPSVSSQLNGFEQRYRVKLFAREGHTFRLTPVGTELLPKIRAALAIVAEIEKKVVAERALDAGRLVVGYSTDQFVMPVLSRFMARHPAVRVEALSLASLDLLERLREGRIEAAFLTLPAPEADLEWLELRRERIVLMARPDHPLAGRTPLGWAELEGISLIRREKSSGTRRVFDRAAEAAGARFREALDLGSWASLRAAVVAGIGVGVAMAGEIGEDPEIAVLAVDDPSLEVGHYLATLPTLRLLATVSALFEACREVAQANVTVP